MSDLSKITLPNGDTYDLKDTYALSGIESTGGSGLKLTKRGGATSNVKVNTQDLVWPNGLRGIGDVTIQSLVSNGRANKLAFLPADQIIIEQTVDGGVTWTDAGFTDGQKEHLFAETREANISLPKINSKINTLCGIRVTFTAMKYDVPDNTAETDKYSYWNSTYVKSTERYCSLNCFYFWVAAPSSSINVVVQSATGGAPNTWRDRFRNNDWWATGWAGSDFIPSSTSDTFGGATTQTGNTWNWRITFMSKGESGSDTIPDDIATTKTQKIIEIRGYGINTWTSSNPYMNSDHLYSIDVNKNATFPANVSATNFIGNLTGNVSGTAANVTGTIAIANGGTGATTAANARSNLGLGNVENKSSATIRGELTKSNVTTALGYTPYTPAEVDALVSAVFHYKGTKATFAEVQALTGMKTGDVWQVTADNSEYVYNGTTWEKLGPTIDLSGYLTSVSVAGQELTPTSNSITVAQLKTALGLKAAAYVDTESTLANDGKLPTGAAVKSFVEGKGYVTTDTKNTAGSTDTSSKIFLIGATSQAANPQTYSDNEVYATSGVLTTKSTQVGGGAVTMQYNTTTESLDFIFA